MEETRVPAILAQGRGPCSPDMKGTAFGGGEGVGGMMSPLSILALPCSSLCHISTH